MEEADRVSERGTEDEVRGGLNSSWLLAEAAVTVEMPDVVPDVEIGSSTTGAVLVVLGGMEQAVTCEAGGSTEGRVECFWCDNMVVFIVPTLLGAEPHEVPARGVPTPLNCGANSECEVWR